MVTCAVDGCGKPVKKNGYCHAHYMKSWRYGTPTPVHKSRTVDLMDETRIDRLLRKAEEAADNHDEDQVHVYLRIAEAMIFLEAKRIKAEAKALHTIRTAPPSQPQGDHPLTPTP